MIWMNRENAVVLVQREINRGEDFACRDSSWIILRLEDDRLDDL